MKVIVKSPDIKLPLFIWLPSLLIYNPAAAAIATKYVEELSFDQMSKLMSALRKAKKQLGGTPLVEVKGKDGENVTVYL